MVNAVRLRATLTRIEDAARDDHERPHNPDSWDQRRWRCTTGMCAAGHTSVLYGGTWAAEPHDLRKIRIFRGSHVMEYVSGFLVATDDDPAERTTRLDGVPVVHARERAARLLDLSEVQADLLFAPFNTLDDLRRITGLLIREVPHVTITARPYPPRDWEDPDGDEPVLAARLVVTEQQAGFQVWHDRYDAKPHELPAHARRIAESLGVPYIDPIDPTIAALVADPTRREVPE